MYKKVISQNSDESCTKKAMPKINDLSQKELLEKVENFLRRCNIPEEARKDLDKDLDTKFWLAALKIGEAMDAETDPVKKEGHKMKLTLIRNAMGRLSEIKQDSTPVVFGTSGWRGKIGEDFTIANVHKVVKGIIEMMKTEEFLKENRYASFKEVQGNGIVVMRDNRFMGDAFMDAAIKELRKEGIKVHFAGQCPTGVGSAVVKKLGAAGSINFTPSHNPMDAAGLKFNPADGGPADKNLTSLIEKESNKLMDAGYEPATLDAQSLEMIKREGYVNAAELYREFLRFSKIIDIDQLRKDLIGMEGQIEIIVDNMHGSSRGFIQKILGHGICRLLDIKFKNTDEDPSFHGVKPEPSAKNQKVLIDELKKSDKKFTLAVALDPDADRIRFADKDMDIDMNHFGALALKYAIDRGLRQGVASTAPSSDFALAIADQEGLGDKVNETAVGFKYFRGPLSKQNAAVAFEESDGISFVEHTLEKDAIIGFLVALSIIIKNQKNLSEVFADLQKQYGYFYPNKDSEELPPMEIKVWEAYKLKVVKVLQEDLYKEGDELDIAGKKKRIAKINTIDGLKLIFEDKSWILLRPSGTQANFRYYYETVGEGNDKLLPAYKEAASEILKKARAIVDGK